MSDQSLHEESQFLRKRVMELELENAFLRQRVKELDERKRDLDQAENDPEAAIPPFPEPNEDDQD